jgi:hypothetical protein
MNYMNKNSLKLAGLLFCLSIINILVIVWWWVRGAQTGSNFYFGAFEYGGIIYALGIPTLFLLWFAFILYKGNTSPITRSVMVILAAIVFLAPYVLYLSSDQPKTYQEYQNSMKQNILEKWGEKLILQCAEYKQKVSEYHEGQPVPTPPDGTCPGDGPW